MSSMMETCIDMERYWWTWQSWLCWKCICVFIFMFMCAFTSLYPKCYQSLPLTSGPPGDFCFYFWVLEEWQRAYMYLPYNRCFKNPGMGAWVAQLVEWSDSWFRLRSWSHISWDQGPCGAPHWQCGACLGFSLSLCSSPPCFSQIHSPSLPPSLSK